MISSEGRLPSGPTANFTEQPQVTSLSIRKMAAPSAPLDFPQPAVASRTPVMTQPQQFFSNAHSTAKPSTAPPTVGGIAAGVWRAHEPNVEGSLCAKQSSTTTSASDVRQQLSRQQQHDLKAGSGVWRSSDGSSVVEQSGRHSSSKGRASKGGTAARCGERRSTAAARPNMLWQAASRKGPFGGATACRGGSQGVTSTAALGSAGLPGSTSNLRRGGKNGNGRGGGKMGSDGRPCNQKEDLTYDRQVAGGAIGSSTSNNSSGERSTSDFMARVAKRSQFYKTRMCPWIDNGRCCRGDACNYAHSASELRSAPDLSRTSLCPSTDKCTNVRCRFAHNLNELRATNAFYKTRICIRWQVGQCVSGTRCRMAHGEHELRHNQNIPILCRQEVVRMTMSSTSGGSSTIPMCPPDPPLGHHHQQIVGNNAERGDQAAQSHWATARAAQGTPSRGGRGKRFLSGRAATISVDTPLKSPASGGMSDSRQRDSSEGGGVSDLGAGGTDGDAITRNSTVPLPSYSTAQKASCTEVRFTGRRSQCTSREWEDCVGSDDVPATTAKCLDVHNQQQHVLQQPAIPSLSTTKLLRALVDDDEEDYSDDAYDDDDDDDDEKEDDEEEEGDGPLLHESEIVAARPRRESDPECLPQRSADGGGVSQDYQHSHHQKAVVSEEECGAKAAVLSYPAGCSDLKCECSRTASPSVPTAPETIVASLTPCQTAAATLGRHSAVCIPPVPQMTQRCAAAQFHNNLSGSASSTSVSRPFERASVPACSSNPPTASGAAVCFKEISSSPAAERFASSSLDIACSGLMPRLGNDSMDSVSTADSLGDSDQQLHVLPPGPLFVAPTIVSMELSPTVAGVAPSQQFTLLAAPDSPPALAGSKGRLDGVAAAELDVHGVQSPAATACFAVGPFLPRAPVSSPSPIKFLSPPSAHDLIAAQPLLYED